jgi:hypothetical protein
VKVSAVVVSRMDHKIGPVLDSILPHVEDLTVVRGHAGVWERWEAAAAVREEIVYTQDDDAIVDVPAVLAAYETGLVTCNMPLDRRAEYHDGIALVGWGAVFDRGQDRDYPRLFKKYLAWSWGAGSGVPDVMHFWDDPVFRSECDRVFTGLSKLKLIDVPFAHQAAAYYSDRMGQRACHGEYMKEIRRRIYAVRAAK